MKTQYIFSIGEIKRKDNSIAFKNEKGWKYIPIEQVRELYFMNEVSLNSKFFDFCSRAGIVLHFFNYYGNYSGTFFPRRKYISGELTIKQALAYERDRLKIAKAIVLAISENIYEVLYHYYRHGKGEIKEFLDYLKFRVPMFLEKAKDINKILFIEGQIWAGFYESFRYFLPNDFLMNKRVKRPPDNPINALISFGNTLLYTKTISAIYQTHLDQSISFLHSPSSSRFSLSLDLSEAFKPVVVFKVIFELVNRKKLKLQKHFERKFNYALLNEDGKKIFIKAFEEKLNEKFSHSKLKRKVSYQRAITLDGYKLVKYLIEGKEFRPFSLKEKK
ncbi:type I-B CRISPR-associated endonuclease Cas1b [Caminibacter profundus]